ncbi:MAG TPA: hypothetical protein VMT96_00170 [Candidatus Bathyarchaeia archaeon]|nr:hypothetical protein [Candidatus Bathyarchaeia archaeon]
MCDQTDQQEKVSPESAKLTLIECLIGTGYSELLFENLVDLDVPTLDYAQQLSVELAQTVQRAMSEKLKRLHAEAVAKERASTPAEG